MGTLLDARRDADLMARAVALAERGRGPTRPNPIVGCVISDGDGIVGEGWHERAGGPHAEVVALAQAGERARGATVHVTLEPCDHHGRTPPCSRALVDAGVARVVYALADANPAASGGRRTLVQAGVEVEEGPFGGFVAQQNRAFLRAATAARPDVTLKLAQTFDGSLVAAEGRWITGPRARAHVHRLRDRADAVLVGSGTVLADDPRLDVRHVELTGAPPRPVVLDSRGRIPLTANVVRAGSVVVTTATSPDGWRRSLADVGVEVVTVAAGLDGHLDLRSALAGLHERGIQAVLAEPGATLAGALVQRGLVDRLVVHVAGPARASALADCLRPPAGTRWRPVLWRRLADDEELVLIPEAT